MWVAKIFSDEYPEGCWFGSLIGAPDYDSALLVFKVRFPNWVTMNFEIIEF